MTKKMDRELKAKWVEALRSGEYDQCRMMLEDDGAFCCLGVLCKIQGLDTQVEVDQAYQLAQNQVDGQFQSLVNLNDCDRASFDYIADYIEANL